MPTTSAISKAQKERLDEKYKYNLANVDQAIKNICGLYMANIAELADPPFQPVLDYLNRNDVREAIHAKKGTKLTESWSQIVSNNYSFGVNDSYADMVLELLKEGLQIIVSRTHDAKDCNFQARGLLNLLTTLVRIILKKKQRTDI
jgi:cathepsin A (carboxypeptidase C)